MTDNELKRVESYQYPAAHLGHLTHGQQLAFDRFKVLCEKEGYYSPGDPGSSKQPSHDDETLLRYLRARKFNPKDALVQFKDTEDWRKQNRMDELYENIDIGEYEETRRLYPQWTGRRDRRGIPVYLFEVAHLKSKAVSTYEKSISMNNMTTSGNVPAKMLRLFALYENLTRFVMPLCSAITDRNHPETPISQSSNIVDISKVGLKQFWSLKSHMQDASTLATAHYPETLDRIFIIGAPSFFPTVWGWIKRWFDPITVSKIFILTEKNMKSTLEQYIDTVNIPKKYGGQLDFEFGMMPVLEPEIENAIQWKEPAMQGSRRTIPTGPIRFEDSADSQVRAIAVGSVNGKPRRQVVAALSSSTAIRAMHGSLVSVNIPIDEKELALTTTGTATQNIPEGDLLYGQDELSSESDPPTPPSTLLYQSNTPTNKTTSPRPLTKGTSVLNHERRDGAHATGELTENTPHTSINHGSLRGNSIITEPQTAGQAHKDTSALSIEETEPQGTSYLGHTKVAVAQAYGKATITMEPTS